jgi:hypothetical protein
MNIRNAVGGAIALFATLAMWSTGRGQERDSYRLYEMQYELAELRLMSQLDQGVQNANELTSVLGHPPPGGRHPTQEECVTNVSSFQIRAQVDGRLAAAHGDRYPFLIARSNQYHALLKAWQLACAPK